MRSRLVYVAVLALLLSACHESTTPSDTTTTTSSTTTDTTTTTTTVTEVVVTGIPVLTGLAQRSQLTAVANLSDGTTTTITTQATWLSSDT